MGRKAAGLTKSEKVEEQDSGPGKDERLDHRARCKNEQQQNTAQRDSRTYITETLAVDRKTEKARAVATERKKSRLKPDHRLYVKEVKKPVGQ